MPAGPVPGGGSGTAGVPPGSSSHGGRVPSLVSHFFGGEARCLSIRARVSRIIASTAASYSSQFVAPTSSNGCGSGAAVVPAALAGFARWRITVIWRRKNHPAAAWTVFSSRDRSWRRRARAASAADAAIIPATAAAPRFAPRVIRSLPPSVRR
ncbi:MAG: hypothetical protein K2P78_11740, partial [Gemmataceae bacterium]|nr:hypothetical protein [Gemmataceae bacterium]